MSTTAENEGLDQPAENEVQDQPAENEVQDQPAENEVQDQPAENETVQNEQDENLTKKESATLAVSNAEPTVASEADTAITPVTFGSEWTEQSEGDFEGIDEHVSEITDLEDFEATEGEERETGDEHHDLASDDETQSAKERRLAEEKLLEHQSSKVTLELDISGSDKSTMLEDEEAHFILIEETIVDDLGREISIKHRVPVLKETRRYERISIVPEDDATGVSTHKYLETITRVIKKSKPKDEDTDEVEEFETEIKEVIELDHKPKGVQIYTKQKTEDGKEIEVLVKDDEEESTTKAAKKPELTASVTSVSAGEDKGAPAETKGEVVEKKTRPPRPRKIEKKKVFKVVKQIQIEPCTHGKLQEVIKPTEEEIEIEEEDLDFEDYESEEDLSESELELQREEIKRKRLERVARLKDNLRTVLVRLALAEKKRTLYMQLISISSEVKEDILHPPDPNKPAFKVPKKVKLDDKYKKMYFDKLMEYRELRSVILVKLALEKKRKEEVKAKYDVIAAQVAQLRKEFEGKLNGAIKQLLPKNDIVFKNQSAHGMVKRVLELIDRLDQETKELMYKKKQMCLSKQKYDEVTENQQGLSYKFALANEELSQLLGKNHRRQERLEALKLTLQKECMAIAQINQKCDVIMKVTDEKKSRLESLNYVLNNARQDRRIVHTARRKVEKELRDERTKVSLKNHPYLLKEYQLVEELLRGKHLEYQQLKRDCISSIERTLKSESHKT